MKRIHAIEIHEQSWCPAPIRDAATDYLQFVAHLANSYAGIVERLGGALRASGSAEILDLCSGGGGPWARLQDALSASRDQPVRVRLSDLHPNRAAFERFVEQSGARVEFEPEPVSASDVPPELPGFRTLFASFHHFRPPSARAILEDAVRDGRGIAVFEPMQRGVLAIVGVLLAPLAVLVLTPLIRPFRWSRLLFTYLLPLVPLVVLFDGIVSCLRTYSTQELREMIATIDAPSYVWEIGSEAVRGSPVPLTYLIGYPGSG